MPSWDVTINGSSTFTVEAARASEAGMKAGQWWRDLHTNGEDVGAIHSIEVHRVRMRGLSVDLAVFDELAPGRRSGDYGSPTNG